MKKMSLEERELQRKREVQIEREMEQMRAQGGEEEVVRRIVAEMEESGCSRVKN